MAIPSRKLFEELERRYQSIDRSRRKLVSLRDAGTITEREAILLIESLYLNAHSGFENFLERLFVGLVSGTYASSLKSIKPKVSFRSVALTRQVILGPKLKYMDWLPYERTTKLADIYLSGGKPFNALVDSEKGSMTKSTYIRNDIAHKTKSTHDLFLDRVIGTTTVSSREKQPGSYLLGIYRLTPTPQTRFELYLGQLLGIARKLSR